jgi:hypothetical protein
MMNRQKVEEYFKDLEAILTERNLLDKPKLAWNMDETGKSRNISLNQRSPILSSIHPFSWKSHIVPLGASLVLKPNTDRSVLPLTTNRGKQGNLSNMTL